MKQEIEKIRKDFLKIKNKGWIKSERKGNGGIGYTLEKELGIAENNLEIPDLINFELKSHRFFSKSHITLFNATPDGDSMFEISRLQTHYGYPDKDNPQYNIINCDVFANRICNLGSKYKQTLKIDEDNRKIRLHILTNNLNLIDNKTSWSYSILRKNLKEKCNI